MPSVEVRPFRRRDREQLTCPLNAHAATVVPGLSVLVAMVLGQLEREPGEFVVVSWVRERVTLVAEQLDRVVAAVHILRYASDDRVNRSYCGIGEIRWLLFGSEAPASGSPYWTDTTPAAQQLMTDCIRQMEAWGVTSQEAGGELPVTGVYAIPGQWPHIRALYEQAGFKHTGHCVRAADHRG